MTDIYLWEEVVDFTKIQKGGVNIKEILSRFQKGFEGVDVKLVDMEKRLDQRFDRVEKLLENEYRRRIEKLEDQVQYLRDLLAVK